MTRFTQEWKKTRWPASRIMLHFLIPYVLILMVSLLVGVLVNWNTIALLEQEVVNNNHAILEQGRRSTDRRLSEISSITQFVAGGNPVLAFQNLQEPFLGRNVMQILNTRSTLTDYTLTNNFILGYFVLYQDSDVVLGPNLTYRMSDFQELMFRFPTLSEQEWRSLLFEEYHLNDYLPVMPAIYRGRARDVIACLYSLDNSTTSRGVVRVLIDNKQMQSEIAGLNMTGDGWAYIADQEGNILTSIETASGRRIPESLDFPETGHSFRKDDLLITHTTSDYNGWRYVMAQPYVSVIHKVTQVNNTMLMFFFIFLLAGILIASLLAYRNSGPLEKLVLAIRGRDGVPADVRKVYPLIGSTLSNLMVNNEALRQNAEEQLPVLRDSFFRRLFGGDIQSEQELHTWMHHVALEISGNAFGVVILHLRGYQDELSAPILEELAMKRLLLREALRDAGRKDIHLHDLDQDDVALLIPCAAATRNAWEATVRSVLLALDSQLVHDNHLILSSYVGDVHGSLLDVSLSCKEARSLMHFSPPANWNQAIWFWEFPKDTKIYYFPEELEVRLGNQIRAGLHHEAAALLDDLEKENLQERSLSKVTQTMFLYELLGALAKIQEQIPVGERHLRAEIADIAASLMEGTEPPNVIFDTIRERLLHISGGLDDRKKSHNNRLVVDILKHLDENYTDANLCLAAVARQFHLSEVYLSQFFKEQTGENFSVRLEQIRRQKALAFLKKRITPSRKLRS